MKISDLTTSSGQTFDLIEEGQEDSMFRRCQRSLLRLLDGSSLDRLFGSAKTDYIYIYDQGTTTTTPGLDQFKQISGRSIKTLVYTWWAALTESRGFFSSTGQHIKVTPPPCSLFPAEHSPMNLDKGLASFEEIGVYRYYRRCSRDYLDGSGPFDCLRSPKEEEPASGWHGPRPLRSTLERGVGLAVVCYADAFY